MNNNVARFPRTVLLAGVYWSIFSSALLLYLLVWFLPRIEEAIENNILRLAIWQIVPGMLVGSRLLLVAVRILLGIAKDVAWIARGSIALGAFIGVSGAVSLLIHIATGPSMMRIITFLAGTVLGPGCLVAAGILALVGRDEYLAWKKVQESRLHARTKDEVDRVP